MFSNPHTIQGKRWMDGYMIDLMIKLPHESVSRRETSCNLDIAMIQLV